jgi:hypothetical protein
VEADAELAADLHLAQRPGHEGPGRADRDELPEAAFAQWREAEAVFQVRWRDVDLPQVPGRPDGRAPDDQQRAEDREEGRE